MKHAKKINHLGRKAAHRKAMLSNMAASLIEHKRIFTTVAKAKALRKYIEPLLTKSKTNTTHNRRVVFSYLQNKYAIQELFDEVATKIADRPGGYTRIIKTGTRSGDGADMAMIELVDYNEIYTQSKSDSIKGKRSRRRRGGKGASKKTTPEAATATQEVAEKEVVGESAVVEQVDEVVEEQQQPTEEVEVVEEKPVEEEKTEEQSVEEPVAEKEVEEPKQEEETSNEKEEESDEDEKSE